MTAVRAVAAADREQWLGLWSEWQAHMEGRVPEDVSRRSFDMMVTAHSGLRGLMAFDGGGRALGFATVSTTPFAWTGGPVLFLQDLFVSAAARGAGVGRDLLRAVYGLSDDLGCEQVFWFVDEGNVRLQQFYESEGIRTPFLRFMRGPWPW